MNRRAIRKKLVWALGSGSMTEENLFRPVAGVHGFAGQKSLVHHFDGMIRVAILFQEEDFAGIHGF